MKNLTTFQYLRKVSLLFLLLSVMIQQSVIGSGSQMKRIASKVQQLQQNQVNFIQVPLFTVSSNQNDAKAEETLHHFTLLDRSVAAVQSVLTNQPEYIRITIPATGSMTPITALLYKTDLSPNGFTLLTSSKGEVTPTASAVHYRGIIENDYSSVVSFSFSMNETMGIFSDARGNFVLGALSADSHNRYVFYNDIDLIPAASFGCETNTSDAVRDYQQQHTNTNQPATFSVNCVNWYYETDYDIFTNKGSVANVTTYIQGVFNQVATLYDNDGVSITLLTLFVWDTTDPYTGPSTSNYLSQFGTYRTSFTGDLANLVGYGGGGGVAYVNQLCGTTTSLKMGYSGINSTYSNVPTYSWTVEVITHEDGHLLGSRHTHDCVWNGNNTRIDGCGPAAGYPSGSCATGPIPTSGTIMSYCHLVSAGINFSLGFGPQPQALILNNVNNASCLVACGPCPTPPQPGTISGSSTVCTAGQFTYSVAAVSGATSYLWTLPAGWSGTSTTNSITVNTTTSGGTISVAAVNACGTGTARTLSITGGSAPSQPGAITGNTAVCAGTSYNYSVAAVPGATSYIWSLPAGWSGASSTNNITVVSGTAGGTLSVVAVNSCGNSIARTTSTLITPVPAQPSPITGSTSVCPGSTQVYSVTLVQGANMVYNWNLPSGWSGTSSSNTITVIAGSTGGTITVFASNVCGAGVAQTLTVTSAPLPAIPSTIATAGGAVKVCPGDIKTYSIGNVSGATSYTWTAPPGATITSGQGTTSVVVSYGAGFTQSDSLKVYANNGCGAGPVRFLKINRNTPATPGVITGASTSVCNGTNIPYSITNVAGITYNWSFSVGGASIVSGQGTNSVLASFTPNYISGNIQVTASNNCGTSAARVLLVKSTPATPPAISGPVSVCANQTGVPYSITPVAGATSYTWEAPTGARISDGVTTSTTSIFNTTSPSVTVNFKTTAGNVKVKALNACGAGANRLLAVAITCRQAESLFAESFHLFPNPAKDQLNIEFESDLDATHEIRLLDISGKSVVHSKGNSISGMNQKIIDISGLPAGMYFIEVTNGNQRLTGKVAIE